MRRSEAPDVSGQAIQEAQDKVDFLQREASYNVQVGHALASIKHVSGLLDQVEQARDERRILDSLHLLERKNPWKEKKKKEKKDHRFSLKFRHIG